MHAVRGWIQQGISLLKHKILTSKAIWFIHFQMEVTNITWVENVLFSSRLYFKLLLEFQESGDYFYLDVNFLLEHWT